MCMWGSGGEATGMHKQPVIFLATNKLPEDTIAWQQSNKHLAENTADKLLGVPAILFLLPCASVFLFLCETVMF